MKINFFKGFVILFSCICIASITIFQTFSRRSSKHKFDLNNVFNKPKQSFSPFFYHKEASYFDVQFNTGYNTRYNEDVVEEWEKFLKDKVNVETVKYFLLNDNAKTEIREIHYNADNNKEFEHIERFQLNDPKINNFFEFIYFAKEVEKSSVSSRYSWNYDQLIVPIISNDIICQLIEKHKNSSDEFIKNRYWFQIIKAYFYSHRNDDLIIFFDKTKQLEPKNNLFYRAMSYVAGVYEQKKDYAMANYLYSVIFENCPNMRTMMSNNFRPKSIVDFKKSLVFAKIIDEKCALWTLYGFRADKKMAIAEIYKINPKSPYLDFLLPKMIDEEEVRLNSLSTTSPLFDKKYVKGNLDREIFLIVKLIAGEEKTLKPYLWQMASGYLSLFNYDRSYAKHQFAKVKRNILKNEELYSELRALELLCEISGQRERTSLKEKYIASELNWLYSIKTSKEQYGLKNIQEYCYKIHGSY